MKSFYLWLALPVMAFSQIGINTVNPSPAAALDISSSNDAVHFGGMLAPRVTLAQRNAIPVTSADDGMVVFLTNGTQRCLQIYDATDNEWENIYCLNHVPVAAAVSISGTAISGQMLSGAFTYGDSDGDAAGTHTFKWYRANDSSGAGAVAIAGATAQTYTLTDTDVGKHICFEVTPVATTGSSPGLAVKSAYSGPVAAKPTIISFVQLAQSINENASPSNVILRFSYPNVSTSNVSVTVSASAYGRLTQTAPVTIVIPAGTPSPYNATVFNVKNNTLDDNNTTLTFTITNVTGGSGTNSVGSPNTDTCLIVDDEVSLSFSEAFTTFSGNGFDPPPNTGRLDSDKWRIYGDLGQTAWGGTSTTGEPARGLSTGNVANNLANFGAYAYSVAGNRALGLKTGGSNYYGGIKFRIQNTTGATLSNWTVAYTLLRYNNAVAGNIPISMNYSTSDGAYTNIASTANAAAGTTNTWTSYSYNASITVSVPPNGYLYFFLEAINEAAYQYCDEFGIDNVSVTGKNF